MKRTFLGLIILLAFSQASGQTTSVVNALDLTERQISEEQLDLIFKKTQELPANTEVSIGFIKDGEISYYGVRRSNDSLIFSNNSDHIFEIGSITKVFTSTLLANFVLDSIVKIDDRIQDYLDFRIKNRKITFLQLANHTSGLPKLPSNLNLEEVDFSNPYKDYDEAQLKEYLTQDLKTLTKPGKNYEYSNTGAGILGYILASKANTTYEDLLQKYIFSKYEMKNSTTDRSTISSKLVDGLDAKGKKTSNWDLNALVGAGGILSSIEDLSKFALAQFDIKNRELELTRKSTFDYPKYQMKVGLAWNIISPKDNVQWHAHNGGTGGFSSMLVMDVENKNGVLILSNVSSFNEKARNIEQLCIGLMRMLTES